jgi:hypothetical protein
LKNRFIYTCLLIVLLQSGIIYGQNTGLTKQEVDLMKANEFFELANYVQALEEYLKLEKKFPHNTDIKRRIGTCYLNIHDDKAKALPYLRNIFNSGTFDDELLLEYGMACQYACSFENAIIAYSMYREKISAKKHALIDHYIETCENAKALVKKPVNVKFENLGKDVNTKFADYYPFVSKDEGALYFTSRREDCLGNTRSAFGYFSSDIYVSKVKNGQWQKAKNIGAPINTVDDEEIVGLTPDGKKMIIYVDRKTIASDLMHTDMQKNKNFGNPLAFTEPVNTEGLELEGCYTADANTMYFVAVRKNGMGEADIYSTHRLPSGDWGIPQNLGPNINTIYKEGFPVVSEDGQTLYFASQGHTSMGGFDIFKSKWDEEKKEWGKAENIGYPVNTPDDDMMFSLVGTGRDGYLSAWRKEGFGDLDLYKVTFLDVEQPLTAMVGVVKSADSTKTTIDANITLFDSKTNQEIETKNVNKKTGRYIFIVEPGKYKVVVNCKGCKSFTEEINVYDKSDYTVEMVKNFALVSDK